jgi:hypothetical protein
MAIIGILKQKKVKWLGFVVVAFLIYSTFFGIICNPFDKECRLNASEFYAVAFSNAEKRASAKALKKDFRLKAIPPGISVCLLRPTAEEPNPCYTDWGVPGFDCQKLRDSAIGETWSEGDYITNGLDRLNEAKIAYFKRYNREILSYPENPYRKNCRPD